MAEAVVEMPRHAAPSDWRRVSLGDLLRESTLRARSLGIHAAEVPVLSITRHGGLVLQSKKFGKRIAGRDISGYKLVKRGQIVCGFPLDEGVIYTLEDQALGVVSPVYMVWDVASDLAYSGFLSQLMRMPSMCRRYMDLASRTVHRRRIVKKNDFLAIEIELPPLHEQQRIARMLGKIQKAIEAQDKVIAAARELKRSLMRHLFTYGPVSLNDAAKVSLKETELGRVPNHWGIVPLGEKARIGNGSTPRRTDARFWAGGTIPWLTSGKVHDGVISHADEFVTEVARRECHLPLVPKGSLVVAITGQGKTLGNSALLTTDACVSQHLAYITVTDQQLPPKFLLAYLRSQYSHLQEISRAGGSTKGALTCGFLTRLPLPLPPYSEQQEIARQLGAVLLKIDLEDKRKMALEALYQSALHHLMTGKIRVRESLEV